MLGGRNWPPPPTAHRSIPALTVTKLRIAVGHLSMPPSKRAASPAFEARSTHLPSPIATGLSKLVVHAGANEIAAEIDTAGRQVGESEDPSGGVVAVCKRTHPAVAVIGSTEIIVE